MDAMVQGLWRQGQTGCCMCGMQKCMGEDRWRFGGTLTGGAGPPGAVQAGVPQRGRPPRDFETPSR